MRSTGKSDVTINVLEASFPSVLLLWEKEKVEKYWGNAKFLCDFPLDIRIRKKSKKLYIKKVLKFS